tara:strand:+ start:194 stop:544 length:351 start_codon:yes stop_codon:yes gene_type:complete
MTNVTASQIGNADTSWRNWKVKNGRYDTEHSGAIFGWFIVASVPTHPDEGPPWIVLGTYSTEDEDCCWPNDKVKWYRYLQDQAVWLADEKGLVPEHTVISIVEDSFDGSVLWGAEE